MTYWRDVPTPPNKKNNKLKKEKINIKKKVWVHFQASLALSTTCFGKPGQSNFWEKVPGKSFCHKTRHTSDYVFRHCKCSTVCCTTLVNNAYKVIYSLLLQSGTLFCTVFRHSKSYTVCYTTVNTVLYSF